MKCEKCGFDNLEEAVFCIKCGSRLDGYIPCPKCGEYIPNDSIKCPHCGKAIPHKSEAKIQKNEELSATKRKISRVFNRVSFFVSLALITLIMMISCLDLGLTASKFQNDLNFVSSSSVSTVDYIWIGFRYSFALIDFVIVFVFGIIAIRKMIVLKRTIDISGSYKYLAVLLASKTFSLTMLYALTSSNKFDDFNVFSTLLIVPVALLIIHLFICVGFDCFLNFRRGAVSIFIARIILGVGILIPFSMIYAFSNSNIGFLYSDGQYLEVGILARFLRMCEAIGTNYTSSTFVSAYVLNCSSITFAVLIVSLSFSLAVYSFSCYFRGMNKFRKFRIVFYLLVIALSILSTSYLISSIVEVALYEKFLGSYRVHFPEGPISIFLMSALLVGVAISVFNIYNRASRRAALEERTAVTK